MIRALQSCVGTKFSAKWGKMIQNLALKALRTIMIGGNLNKLNLEVKRYAKVEKVQPLNPARTPLTRDIHATRRALTRPPIYISISIPIYI